MTKKKPTTVERATVTNAMALPFTRSEPGTREARRNTLSRQLLRFAPSLKYRTTKLRSCRWSHFPIHRRSCPNILKCSKMSA